MKVLKLPVLRVSRRAFKRGFQRSHASLKDVRIGMRLEAVWRPESEWDYNLSNIKYFRPIDEPDVPFDEIKEYS